MSIGNSPKPRRTGIKPLKSRLMVNIFAGPVEWAIASATRQGLGAQITERLFQACSLLHLWTGRLLVHAGSLIGRGLAHLSWSCRLGLLVTLLASLAIKIGFDGWAIFCAKGELKERELKLLEDAGLIASTQGFLTALLVAGLLLVPACFLPFIRHRSIPFFLKGAGIVFTLAWLPVLWLIMSVPGALQTLGGKEGGLSKGVRNAIWMDYGWFWIGVMAAAAIFLLCLHLRAVREYYSSIPVAEPLVGDRIVENILTNGKDPVYRTSLLWAAWLHVFVLFILPVLLNSCYLLDDYNRPPGGGEMAPPVKVKTVQPKKEKQKKLILNVNSPIIMARPDIEKDSQVLEDIQQVTENTYTAASVMGKGKNKKKPGFGGDKIGAVVRFIRLQYDGGNWNDGMGVGADNNMLIEFNNLTKIPVAKSTESRTITELGRFRKGSSPPFVMIKGAQGFRLSSDEVKTLRKYCTQEGGMLFVDCGSRRFADEVRRELGRVFNNPQWVDIANDDVLYQQPYSFPNGAPSVFSHAGKRGLGIKSPEGRWMVFLHPGDLADLWRSGNAGATKEQATRGFMMGANIIFYAFSNYIAIHQPESAKEE